MPTKQAIREHWAPALVTLGKYDSIHEATSADTCMACGWLATTERCHITPRDREGPNIAANLHLLCDTCHHASEHLTGSDYWQWFTTRNMLHTAMTIAYQQNPSL